MAQEFLRQHSIDSANEFAFDITATDSYYHEVMKSAETAGIYQLCASDQACPSQEEKTCNGQIVHAAFVMPITFFKMQTTRPHQLKSLPRYVAQEFLRQHSIDSANEFAFDITATDSSYHEVMKSAETAGMYQLCASDQACPSQEEKTCNGQIVHAAFVMPITFFKMQTTRPHQLKSLPRYVAQEFLRQHSIDSANEFAFDITATDSYYHEVMKSAETAGMYQLCASDQACPSQEEKTCNGQIVHAAFVMPITFFTRQTTRPHQLKSLPRYVAQEFLRQHSIDSANEFAFDITATDSYYHEVMKSDETAGMYQLCASDQACPSQEEKTCNGQIVHAAFVMPITFFTRQTTRPHQLKSLPRYVAQEFLRQHSIDSANEFAFDITATDSSYHEVMKSDETAGMYQLCASDQACPSQEEKTCNGQIVHAAFVMPITFFKMQTTRPHQLKSLPRYVAQEFLRQHSIDSANEFAFDITATDSYYHEVMKSAETAGMYQLCASDQAGPSQEEKTCNGQIVHAAFVMPITFFKMQTTRPHQLKSLPRYVAQEFLRQHSIDSANEFAFDITATDSYYHEVMKSAETAGMYQLCASDQACPSQEEKTCNGQIVHAAFVMPITFFTRQTTRPHQLKSLPRYVAQEFLRQHSIDSANEFAFDITATDSSYHEVMKSDETAGMYQLCASDQACPSQEEKTCNGQIVHAAFVMPITFFKMQTTRPHQLKSLPRYVAQEFLRQHSIDSANEFAFDITATDSYYHEVMKSAETAGMYQLCASDQACPSQEEKTCNGQIVHAAFVMPITFFKMQTTRPHQLKSLPRYVAQEFLRQHSIDSANEFAFDITATDSYYHEVMKSDETADGYVGVMCMRPANHLPFHWTRRVLTRG